MSSNTAKVLEFAQHAFDDAAFHVHVPVAASFFFAIDFGWDHRRNVMLFKPINQGIGVIPLVSQECARVANVLHERQSLG